MGRPKKNKDKADNTPNTPATGGSNNANIEEEVIIPPTQPTEQPAFFDVFPEADRREIDRYFCVIKNRDGASRISDMITHQRDLGLWGVHQFDNSSRNTYARSFYFKERSNALRALEHAQKLCIE